MNVKYKLMKFTWERCAVVPIGAPPLERMDWVSGWYRSQLNPTKPNPTHSIQLLAMTKSRKLPELDKIKEYVTVCSESPSGLAYVKSKRPVASKNGKRYVVAIAGVYYTAARVLLYLTCGIDPGTDDRIMRNDQAVTRSEIAHGRERDGAVAIKTSSYRGVHWREHSKAWVAKITHNRRPVVLGRFQDELLAAQAYDTAARRLFGDFAKPNFT